MPDPQKPIQPPQPQPRPEPIGLPDINGDKGLPPVFETPAMPPVKPPKED